MLVNVPRIAGFRNGVFVSMPVVFVMMVILDELDLTLLRLAPVPNIQYRLKLVRFWQFRRGFQIRAVLLELENLPFLSAANRLQRYVFVRWQLRFVTVRVEEIEPEAGWNARFKHAQFRSAGLRRDQRPAVGPISLARQMIMMPVPVVVGVFVRMRFAAVRVRVLIMFIRQMHIELGPGNRPTFLPRNVQMVFVQPQLLQLVFERMRVHAEIKHRADEHVAADAAENIEVKRFHYFPAARVLIWAAA